MRKVQPSFIQQQQPKPAPMMQQSQMSYQQAVQSYATHKPTNFHSQTEVKPMQNTVQMMPSMSQPAAPQFAPVQINPVQKPQMVRHLQNQTAQPGQKAFFQCVVKGSPNTEVKWYRNGQPINMLANDPRFPVTYDKLSGMASLTIHNASPQDAGQITCVASNPAGSESSTAFLVVRGKT